MTRIGMILEKKFPSDIRVEKETNALLSAGFEVSLLCKKSQGQQIYETLQSGLQLHRINLNPMTTWQKIIRRLTLVDEAWLNAIRQFISTCKPDVLHVHDFPLIRTALKAANEFDLPVVADLHENMPAAILAYRKGLTFFHRIKDSIERNYYLWKWHEKTSLPLCHQIIIVVPEAAERLYKYGIPKSKISLVSNTESHYTFDTENLDVQVLSHYKDKWIISFIGGVGPHRGIDTIIHAVPSLIKKIPNFLLLIVGADLKSPYTLGLVKLTKTLDVKKYVEFLGWQPLKLVNTYISASTACLVPHAKTEHTETTVPHKLFQYMLVGKPVIVSNVKPLKRIVEETGAGLVFTADDPKSLTESILTLYKNPNSVNTFGENGKKATEDLYSWKHDAARLCKIYFEIKRKFN